MKLILVRHTESVGNHRKVYAGTTDFELTEKGISQIHNVVNRITKMINRSSNYRLYTSPLQRCTFLANEIEKILHSSKIVEPHLRETNFGVFEGKSYDTILKESPEILEGWNNDFIHFKIPQGESLINCYERVNLFCNELKEKNDDSIIVSHGGIIKLILLIMLDLDIDNFWKFTTENGCVIELEYNEGFGFLKNMFQLEEDGEN
jgi:alpha-ribazole phosphatase